MIEISGNIWNAEYHPRVITTNGTINVNGKAVMGRGVALDAKNKYPTLSKQLGTRLKKFGNVVYWFNTYQLFTFPVKHDWWENADLDLITKSTTQLRDFVDTFKSQQIPGFDKIYIVRPGCENGKRKWETEVKPILMQYLDDRFIVVYKYK